MCTQTKSANWLHIRIVLSGLTTNGRLYKGEIPYLSSADIVSSWLPLGCVYD